MMRLLLVNEGGNMHIIVKVVMSSEARVPVLSFAKGRAGQYETTYRGPEEAFIITVKGMI
jgi:hypothetical protein